MKHLKNIWTFLEGKKTFIVAIVILLLSYLQAKGVIVLDQHDERFINGLLTALGLTTLRLAVKK